MRLNQHQSRYLFFRTYSVAFFCNLFFLLFAGCSKEDFSQITTKTTDAAEEVVVSEVVGCSKYSPPPLDILFLYDNSSSTAFFYRDIKDSVREIAQQVTNFKDYNICMTPLIPYADNQYATSCQNYITTLNGNLTSKPAVGLNDISLDGITSNVSAENGIERAYNFLKDQRLGGDGDAIFRKGAYTVVIIVSNGDDTNIRHDSSGNSRDDGVEEWVTKFKSLKNSEDMKRLRFISVVNYESTNKCGSTVRNPGLRYRSLSKLIYQSQGFTDDNSSNPDSYNFCSEDLKSIFAKIGKSINSYKVGHRYKSWPLGSMKNKDPHKLKIIRSSNKERLVQGDTVHGFIYDATTSVENIRSFPPVSAISPAENYAGPFARLGSDVHLTYPECLIVQKEDFAKYYGYVVLQDEPKKDQLSVFVNGKKIPESATNGWSYMGYRESIFLLVKSPTDSSPASPPEEDKDKFYRSGYVIKMNGTAIYSDGDKIEVYFKKAPLK